MDELEAAGLDAHLVNLGEAKRRMGGRNKTDRLDGWLKDRILAKD